MNQSSLNKLDARDRPEPRGLARLDTQGMTELRSIVLHVIDEGWKCSDSCDLRHAWHFMSADSGGNLDDEEFDNKQRLRFCDAITAAIVAKTDPAAAKE